MDIIVTIQHLQEIFETAKPLVKNWLVIILFAAPYAKKGVKWVDHWLSYSLRQERSIDEANSELFAAHEQLTPVDEVLDHHKDSIPPEVADILRRSWTLSATQVDQKANALDRLERLDGPERANRLKGSHLEGSRAATTLQKLADSRNGRKESQWMRFCRRMRS